MINEHAKGELRFLLILFACMTGLLVLLGIVGMIEVDTGERMTSPACAAPGGENECETSADCLDCQKCDDTKEPHKCVADCPPNHWCKEADEQCHKICPGQPPSYCHDCVNGYWEDQCDSDQYCKEIVGGYQCMSDCPPPHPEDDVTDCHDCDSSSGEWEFICGAHQYCDENGACAFDSEDDVPNPGEEEPPPWDGAPGLPGYPG